MNNPFVVDQLTPINPTGQSTKTYQLTKASVHPTRVIGRDSRGMPVEDTIPTVPWRPFLMPDGCINKVPMRTGSVPSNHADALAYENETMYDLVVAGCIPADLCPYSTKFSYITGGGMAAPVNGETDCGGSTAEGGCQHLKAIAKARKEYVLEQYNRDLRIFTEQHRQEFERLRDGIVDGVGAAIAKHALPQSREERGKRMRDGKED